MWAKTAPFQPRGERTGGGGARHHAQKRPPGEERTSTLFGSYRAERYLPPGHLPPQKPGKLLMLLSRRVWLDQREDARTVSGIVPPSEGTDEIRWKHFHVFYLEYVRMIFQISFYIYIGLNILILG